MKRLLVLLAACQAAPVDRLALPEGGRVVEPPAAVGVRVETSACYAGREPGALAAELADRLRPAWGETRIIPSPAAPGRYVVVGEQAGFGVAGVVDTPRRGECAAGEVWVSVGAHPLVQGSATTVGPAGPRRAGHLRLPVVPKTD
jgi:hypothetical protein